MRVIIIFRRRLIKGNPDHLKWLYTIIFKAKAFIGGTLYGLEKSIYSLTWMSIITALTAESSTTIYLTGY